MQLDFKLKYLVACSYGPDSMALLSMALKDGYYVQVAHVNYHKREESNGEEAALKAYCKKHGIKCHVLDTSKIHCEGNFQAWARNVRYEFFRNVKDEEGLDAVLVAHQQDDLIETYLMQKDKKSIVAWNGISKDTTLLGIRVLRPLLNFKKAELIQYDIQNNVPFSIDKSNLENDYTRNQYRHNIVEKLSDKEREQILSEINSLNKCKNIEVFTQNSWDLQEFLKENNDTLILKISRFLQENSEFKRLTNCWIQSLKKSFESTRSCVEIRITKTVSIFKEYGRVVLINKSLFHNYTYNIEKPGKYDFEFISFESYYGLEDRNITDDDYPLTIKPVGKSEEYEIKNYKCKTRRLFIDWKMPTHLRGWWPGIYNKNGKLIYIPRFRDQYTDSHNLKLTIRFPQF